MDKVAEKPDATDKSQESWELSEPESRSKHEKKKVTARYVQNLWKKVETGSDHIIFICLQQLYLT